MKSANSLANTFLIAMPTLTDPNFHHTVSYICEHNKSGAIGIIINRPMMNVFMGEVFDQLAIENPDPKRADENVYYGGPVQQERGFVIHRTGGNWRSTVKTGDEIHITTSRDILEAIGKGKGPDDAIIALGYAGWDAEQLEAEIAQNAWLCCPADSTILFDTPYNEKWEKAAKLLGVDIKSLSGDIGHA